MIDEWNQFQMAIPRGFLVILIVLIGAAVESHDGFGPDIELIQASERPNHSHTSDSTDSRFTITTSEFGFTNKVRRDRLHDR